MTTPLDLFCLFPSETTDDPPPQAGDGSAVLAAPALRPPNYGVIGGTHRSSRYLLRSAWASKSIPEMTARHRSRSGISHIELPLAGPLLSVGVTRGSARQTGIFIQEKQAHSFLNRQYLFRKYISEPTKINHFL